jgi:hypothetical protein
MYLNPHVFSVADYHRLAIPTAFKVHFLVRKRRWDGHDTTSTSVDIVVSSILVATTTVMATTLPFMNPVMGHLQPGWSTGAVHPSIVIEHGEAKSSNYSNTRTTLTNQS